MIEISIVLKTENECRPCLSLAKNLRDDSVFIMLKKISKITFKAYHTMMESRTGYPNLYLQNLIILSCSMAENTVQEVTIKWK